MNHLVTYNLVYKVGTKKIETILWNKTWPIAQGMRKKLSLQNRYTQGKLILEPVRK